MNRSQISKLITLAAVVVMLVLPAFSMAQLSFERIVSGLSTPIFVTHAPDDADRLFIVLRGGQIRIYDLSTNTLKPSPFITVPGVTSGNERGLLGLAFHPDYQSNGLFYVNFTDNSGGDTRITQFSRINADSADATSGIKLMEFDQPQSNHNGGWIGFGQDGYLYIATGDGGGAGDSGSGHTPGTGNAQDTTNNLLGKMLRIDVNGDDFPSDPEKNYAIPADNPFVGVAGDDEIFMYGLRNPWRCSFDRETGDLWIGDVGQNAIEEISFRMAAAPGGQNYGWRNREGTNGSQPAGGSIDPIYQYVQGSGAGRGFCITGGYVYRGPISSLHGHYFFSDYIIGQIRSFRFDGTLDESSYNGNNFVGFANWNGRTTYTAGAINNPSSFGEDLAGNLYCCDLSGGEVFKLIGVATQEAESFTVVNGELNNGGLAELQQSDNSDLVMFRNPSSVQAVTEFELTGTSPTASPVVFEFTLEGNVVARTAVEQTIQLWNYQTGSWEDIDTRIANQTPAPDLIATATPSGNLSRFVDQDSNEIRTKIRYRGLFARLQFSSRTDHAFWLVN